MQNNFFGSKLNSILLLVLIILMVVALVFMYKNKELYLQTFFPSNEQITPENLVVDQNNKSNNVSEVLREYKNDEIGLSFSYPASCGEIKTGSKKDSLFFSAGPENTKDCPIVGLYGAYPDFIDEVGECPVFMDFIERNIKYDEGVNIDYFINENGVHLLLEKNYSDISPVCLPDFGGMSARINLKHTMHGIKLVGDMSANFLYGILNSIKTY
ncbi:MAG: hypothetical protein WDK96_03640 [Candidatus Paceibacterota bacterium]|jgi:hypothetical protein